LVARRRSGDRLLVRRLEPGAVALGAGRIPAARRPAPDRPDLRGRALVAGRGGSAAAHPGLSAGWEAGRAGPLPDRGAYARRRSRGSRSDVNRSRKRFWSWPGAWKTRWFRPASTY